MAAGMQRSGESQGSGVSTNRRIWGALGIDAAFAAHLVGEHERRTVPRLRRLWRYFRNLALDSAAGVEGYGPGADSLSQCEGLPDRLRRPTLAQSPLAGPRREIVIENDIAWRVHTLVDFMFGRPFSLRSCAGDAELARAIERLLIAVFEANGGIAFFQDMALLGSVYGHVDVVVRTAYAPATSLPTPDQTHKGGPGGAGGTTTSTDPTARLARGAQRIVLDLIEAPRGLPMLDPHDYRRIEAYILRHRLPLNRVADEGLLRRWGRRLTSHGRDNGQRASVQRTQIWTARQVVTFEDFPGATRVVDAGPNPLGRMPVVHIQNLPQPFHYEGISDVEPLIPLQDELNIRLSDRANRVTFQSFKMYLGKGIEQFTQRPIGPGQMWATDNVEASIEEFGGDAASPSEDAHINEIREALDKTSGVTPLAAGVLRNKVGHLTSENALRIVLMGLLAKTDRKRVAYGAGIERMCELVLHAADALGILPNRPEDRQVRLEWPSALPESQSQRLHDARLKLDLGVPARQVLTELGYGDCA